MIKQHKLSICIATYNRGKFIGETLDSILVQMSPHVELVIVDGASPDNMAEVVGKYVTRFPEIQYYRQSKNSGVDADYDKAVGYANGEYCWLMTDDDLLRPGAVARVLQAITESPELVVVNSEVKNVDFSESYEDRSLNFLNDKEYGGKDGGKFFAEVASYLSFIGGVVIKRQEWLKRNRVDYYGTLFIHVGVIFQHPPINNIKVIAEPLITIRYGNGMWSPRSFEIWTFKWPQLIWSFADYSDHVKLQITPREPRKSVSRLLRNRALGAFSEAEIKKFWPVNIGNQERFIGTVLSRFPAALANFISVVYLSLAARPNHRALHDLLHSKYASWPSRLFARVLNLKSRKY